MKYIIKGTVIKGEGYGKKLGFPTVNLDSETKASSVGTQPREFPPAGVYSGMAVLDEKEYRAGIVIGPGDKIEAHLIGYNGNAYGKEVTLQIKKFIREYKKFNTKEELIVQIKKDISLC